MIDATIPKVQHPSTRESRGLALYRDHADEIRFEDGVWFVPSQGAGTSVYEVVIGRRVDVCECADFERRGLPCKHIHAATIARSKTRTCAGCSGRFRGRDLLEVAPDSLTFFEGDVLCRPCAHEHGEL